jgi:phage-related minor tail protein
MKKLQQLFVSVALTLLLSISTFAGDGVIITWRTEPTPTPAPVMATSNEAEAECVTNMSAANDSVTEVVLSLLPSVLALF